MDLALDMQFDMGLSFVLDLQAQGLARGHELDGKTSGQDGSPAVEATRTVGPGDHEEGSGSRAPS